MDLGNPKEDKPDGSKTFKKVVRNAHGYVQLWKPGELSFGISETADGDPFWWRIDLGALVDDEMSFMLDPGSIAEWTDLETAFRDIADRIRAGIDKSSSRNAA